MSARSVHNTALDQRFDAYWSIVSDLISLIDRTRGHHVIDEAAEAVVPVDGNVVVLDDVASGQACEAALLGDCNLRLREALHFLLEARSSRKRHAAAGRTGQASEAPPVIRAAAP